MWYHDSDYFREQRVDDIPEWMRAERYQYCETYPKPIKKESLFSKIKNCFKKKKS